MSDRAQTQTFGALAKLRLPPAAREPAIVIPAIILGILALIAILAPWLGTIDPALLDPTQRNKLPGFVGQITLPDGAKAPYTFHMGTDNLGRDIYSRVVYGARVSLIIGALVAIVATAFGLAIGMVAGYVRWSDGLIMRIMDGLMSIPPILIAISLMALSKASLKNVIIAITIAEIPRVTRLVRGVVLSLREQPYVDAAVVVGTTTPMILLRHILPNVMAPLLVQGSYICAAAMITEAILSFIGAGTPPNIPSWGNIMAEGRSLFQIAWWIILFPGIFLSLTVLAMNMLGDGLRDALDPRLSRRM